MGAYKMRITYSKNKVKSILGTGKNATQKWGLLDLEISQPGR